MVGEWNVTYRLFKYLWKSHFDIAGANILCLHWLYLRDRNLAAEIHSNRELDEKNNFRWYEIFHRYCWSYVLIKGAWISLLPPIFFQAKLLITSTPTLSSSPPKAERFRVNHLVLSPSSSSSPKKSIRLCIGKDPTLSVWSKAQILKLWRLSLNYRPKPHKSPGCHQGFKSFIQII